MRKRSEKKRKAFNFFVYVSILTEVTVFKHKLKFKKIKKTTQWTASRQMGNSKECMNGNKNKASIVCWKEMKVQDQDV